MKLLNKTILELNSIIDAMIKTDINTMFAFKLHLNKKKMESVVSTLDTLRTPSEEFKKFESDRVQLIKKYAEKDSNGELVFVDAEKTSVKIIDRDGLKSEFDKLLEDYKVTVDEQESKEKEFNKLLDTEVDVDVVTIPISLFPQELDGAKVNLETLFLLAE